MPHGYKTLTRQQTRAHIKKQNYRQNPQHQAKMQRFETIRNKRRALALRDQRHYNNRQERARLFEMIHYRKQLLHHFRTEMSRYQGRNVNQIYWKRVAKFKRRYKPVTFPPNRPLM